ncbi:ATP-binding protein [Mastigocoleus sp. MO_188.B34]|uniref:ATP-binding protein n=1 Tax=Mastigocoleus sp. MO_188.B34 TaxID=3036635 RepID=UPI00260B8C40|nr:ATP-binding protein [Mastigocoleus sp. MO_188.B34]MDJ0695758.1 ATP-binding protein [Mastigocoleus sp. MO_188.B34]
MNNETMPTSTEGKLKIDRIKNSINSRIQFIQRQAASLLIYQSVLQGKVGEAFLDLLQAIRYTDADARVCLQAYGNFFKLLAARHQNWEEYLITQIIRNENPFSQLAQQKDMENLTSALVAAVGKDLQALQSLHECNCAVLSEWVQVVAHLPISLTVWYSSEDRVATARESAMIAKISSLDNWENAVSILANYYQDFGVGLFAKYQALRWHDNQFIGVRYPDTITLKELIGYETQRDALLKNTEFLLSGHFALNILLYGSRGSGKSSLVKALLNEYVHRELRLLEVSRLDLKSLPEIVEKLRGRSQKFIIFVDDLSFEEDDDAFKALKVVLEGNITARPQNVVVYATSNRRHLIREFFADRPALRNNDEIHAWDTVQEKLSFSDRFGLTLTFEPADRDTYLKIVRQLALQANINLTQEDLDARALQWATRHNGRSGRTAKQFVNYLSADLTVSVSE